MAKTLKELLPQAEVLLDYSFKTNLNPEGVYEGVKVSLRDGEFGRLVGRANAIIVGYGNYIIETVQGMIRTDQMLILDCYVPAYVEVSARNTNDLEREYNEFLQMVAHWNRALTRSDLYLCANRPQIDFYRGVLSALTVINPKSYKDEKLLLVPYGINSDDPKPKSRPFTSRLNNKIAKRILWFGGIYPWFDLKPLIDAVKSLSESFPVELALVGVRNPFNKHPDFVAKADEALSYASDDRFQHLIHLVDWIVYDDRADWYCDCDVIVCLTKPGLENRFSWRTRTVDFIWSGSLIATNGGDPVSDLLFEDDAAYHLTSLDEAGLVKDLAAILRDPERCETIRENLKASRSKYQWDNVMKPLVERILERFPFAVQKEDQCGD